MLVSVLASGSKGNCTYIETNIHKCLIDVGMNYKYISTKLEEIGVNIKDIDTVLITHAHADHINGLKKVMKDVNPNIYLTDKMLNEIGYQLTNYHLITDDFVLDDLNIEVIKLSHDADDINGYILSNDNKSIVYITDTGYINIKNHKRLENKHLYIMESNHDVNMLMKGRYPYHIKMRILGDRGHLSNKDSANYLSKFIGNNTKHIILAHLSHENNDPELALNNLKEILKEKNINNPDILIATQENRTELIEV